MKKILFIVLCILAFAGGLTTIYFVKNNINTKAVNEAYAKYTAMQIESSQFNEEEHTRLAQLRTTIETAKTDKNVEKVKTGIISIQGLVQTSQSRVAAEIGQAYEQAIQNFYAVLVPDAANDWERGEFDRIRTEAQALIDTGAPQDQVLAKINELHGLVASIHQWIAEDGGRIPTENNVFVAEETPDTQPAAAEEV